MRAQHESSYRCGSPLVQFLKKPKQASNFLDAIQLIFDWRQSSRLFR